MTGSNERLPMSGGGAVCKVAGVLCYALRSLLMPIMPDVVLYCSIRVQLLVAIVNGCGVWCAGCAAFDILTYIYTYQHFKRLFRYLVCSEHISQHFILYM